MCCAVLVLLMFGPRILDVLWWLVQPTRWQVAFTGWPGIWWLWPILGIIFLPWTTLMFILVAPLGVEGIDWLWIGLGLLADIASYASGLGRRRVPGYSGY